MPSCSWVRLQASCSISVSWRVLDSIAEIRCSARHRGLNANVMDFSDFEGMLVRRQEEQVGMFSFEV